MGPLLALAQPKLTIRFLESSPTDTANYFQGDSIIHFRAYVENTGNNLLTGNCQIVFRYNQWPDTLIRKEWSAQNFEVGQTDTLIFSDTIFGISGQRYKGGDNIIVIWPHSDNTNVQAPDTTIDSVYIPVVNSAAERRTLDARIDIYPNPANGRLNIRYLESKNKVECVRIIGTTGIVRYQSSRAVDQIDLADLPAGLYYAEFTFKDGLRGAMRFLKEN